MGQARIKQMGIVGVMAALLLLGSCFGSSESQSERQKNADTPAGKMGRVAHAVAKQSEKATRAAGKGLAEAARQARDGWREAAREDRTKGKK